MMELEYHILQPQMKTWPWVRVSQICIIDLLS